ncbi:restriction endonuclease subunit S [Plantactinospora solaniradicis]|uniref:Restriction endonuclease subunit S n=1 Tax=Plantactinospora solaniradicis TaxID=1723736 RepID=A0ABW1KD72_9ACTN
MKPLIGEIPADWREVPLSDVAELQAGPSGAALRTGERTADGIRLVLPRHLQDGRIDDERPTFVGADQASALTRYALRAGDILCVRAGELGKHALVGAGHEGWIYGTSLLRLRPTDAVRPGFLAYYLALPPVQDWIVRHGTGTVIPSIPVRLLNELPVVLPPLAVQESIGEVLAAVDDQVDVHRRISATARRLRDTLAPLLFSGAIPAVSVPRQGGQHQP